MTIRPRLDLDGEEWASPLADPELRNSPARIREAASAILDATGLKVEATGPTLNLIVEYLVTLLEQLTRLAPKGRPVTKKEYERVESLLERLGKTLEQLQDTADPPTLLQDAILQDGGSALDHWSRWVGRVSFVDEATKENGRAKSANWDACADLLAVYEVLYDRAPSGNTSSAKTEPPSIRFLNACFNQVAHLVREETTISAPVFFIAPKKAALEKWLDHEGTVKLSVARFQRDQFLRRKAWVEKTP